jgi:hypothetical protein
MTLQEYINVLQSADQKAIDEVIANTIAQNQEWITLHTNLRSTIERIYNCE